MANAHININHIASIGLCDTMIKYYITTNKIMVIAHSCNIITQGVM
jgi:hypothetical protein